ncbi:MAG: DUF5657 family protein [Candidatus Roizmanbacteria bacterium]
MIPSDFFTTGSLINAFFRVTSIVISVIFIIYSFILINQTRLLNRTVTTGRAPMFFMVALLQLFFGLMLLLLAVLTL